MQKTVGNLQLVNTRVNFLVRLFHFPQKITLSHLLCKFTCLLILLRLLLLLPPPKKYHLCDRYCSVIADGKNDNDEEERKLLSAPHMNSATLFIFLFMLFYLFSNMIVSQCYPLLKLSITVTQTVLSCSTIMNMVKITL